MVSNPKQIQAKVRQLAVELERATRRGLGEVFKVPAKRDEAKFTVLARVVQQIEPGTWQEDPTRALIRVVTKAVKKLPDDYVENKSKTWRGALTWRETGEILCGLRTDLPSKVYGTPLGYNDYVNEVKKQSGFITSNLSQANFQRITGHLRLLLAHKMLDIARSSDQIALEPQPSGAPEPQPPTATTTPALAPTSPDHPLHISGQVYVPRPDQEAQFSQLVSERARVIVFHGQAGMGKTFLARALTVSDDGTEAIRIRFAVDHPLASDLQAALLRIGVDSKSIAGLSDTEKLIELLCGASAPRYVVLDNIEDAQLLTQLIPSQHTAIIVATCRIRHDSAEGYGFIAVGSMDDSEAHNLIASYLPGITVDEIHLLASTLVRYPLAIRHVCSLVRAYSGQSIAELCSELTEDIESLLETMKTTSEEATLYTVLRRVLPLVADRDQYAFVVLESLPFFYYGDAHPFGLLYTYTQIRCEKSIQQHRFERAIHVLSDFALIEVVVDKEGILYAEVHSFVKAVLHELCMSSIFKVIKALAQTCDMYISSPREEYEDVQTGVLRTNAIMQTVKLLGSILIDNRPPGVADHFHPEETTFYGTWLAAAIPEIRPEQPELYDSEVHEALKRELRFTHGKIIEQTEQATRHEINSLIPDHWRTWAAEHAI